MDRDAAEHELAFHEALHLEEDTLDVDHDPSVAEALLGLEAAEPDTVRRRDQQEGMAAEQ